ncbi:MAG: formate--tetrahydrofolate ligase [Christensenellaceae bacterium]|jgi:formate--tetrahydrofolate ligase|nr:formate--tetrahydrofolate ligase [Christensenellaceae bacterium]
MDKTDIEIANSIEKIRIEKIAKKLGIAQGELIKYGEYKAKVITKPGALRGKLVLVTAINPTSAGIGKTTVSIGLADALNRMKHKTVLALREPSLGPVFGIKGGATGGGYAQIVPMEDINLHFNGDFHAFTCANNLLCSLIDNHIFQGNQLNIDPNKILFHRCLDLNDRALRRIICSNGDENARPDSFSITAASEIMAIMCLSENLTELKERLSSIIVALTRDGKPVFARDLNSENAMAILLKDAIYPNLVQTLEGTPALVHCGPFANIAHGCNSITATKLGLSLGDFVITEAGFGADLGAEKFFDLKCRVGKLRPDAVVLVCTVRALKLHGGVVESELTKENVRAVKLGLSNLTAHIKTIKEVFKLPLVVTINKYETDTNSEVNTIKRAVTKLGVPCAVNDVFKLGGRGGKLLAKEVLSLCEKGGSFEFAYDLNQTIEQKIESIAQKVYGAKGVIFEQKAKEAVKTINKLGFDKLPVIIAKTQYSLSDNPKLLGAPKNFEITIRDIEIRAGAGFLVAIAGSIMLMPGLSKTPAAINMTIDENANIKGLF